MQQSQIGFHQTTACRMLVYCLCFLYVFMTHVSCDVKPNASTIKRVRDHIFNGYDINARPVNHHDNTTEVNVGFTPIHITNLDENSGILTIECWVSMMWVDEHLQWDPSKFSGLSLIRVPATEVWRPDLTPYNGQGSQAMPWSSIHVLLNSSGNIWWIPPATLQLICGVSDYRGYPEDNQECTLTLGSWTRDGNQLNIVLSSENVSLDDFISSANPHWELTSVTAKRVVKTYSCCPEPYVSLLYKMKLKRINVPFSALCTTPDTVARILILCMFWIQNGTRKLLVGCTALMILAAIAVGITATLPSPAAAPFALVKVNSAFALCVSALIVELLVLGLASFRVGSPSFVDGLASTTLCQLLNPCSHDEYKEDLMESPPIKANHWIFLATLVDRIAFVVFAVLLLVI